MSGRSRVECLTPTCPGVLGAWAGGVFLPAGHLLCGRDLYVLANGALRVRCSFCNTWHRLVLRPDASRLAVVVHGGASEGQVLG